MIKSGGDAKQIFAVVDDRRQNKLKLKSGGRVFMSQIFATQKY